MRRLWSLLHVPRVVTASMIVGYAGITVGGVMSLVHPPGTIESELGPVITAAWAGFAATGGALGLVSAPRGLWWLERVALIALGTAILIYGSTVAGLQITATGSRWMQLGVLTWAAAGVTSRWFRISWAALDPTKGN